MIGRAFEHTSMEVDVLGLLERAGRGRLGRPVRGGVGVGAVVGARALRWHVLDRDHALGVEVVVSEARARLEQAQAYVVGIDHAMVIKPAVRLLHAAEKVCIEQQTIA